MPFARIRGLHQVLLASASAMLFSTQAYAAGCAAPSMVTPLAVGTVAAVPKGSAQSYSLSLNAGEGVIIDLSNLKPLPAASEGEGNEGGDDAAPRALKLCDSSGNLAAPLPGEVFKKGGSVTATDDGERMRFTAAKAGQYTIVVASGDEPREVLARRRTVGTSQSPVISAKLDQPQKGTVSSSAPVVFSFEAAAGQWVLLRSTSEKDTLLRLAGPDRKGEYSVIAENDDSDGLNPKIRRKLPLAGTYYVQVDGLSEESASFDLTLDRSVAPPPPPAPTQLSVGSQVAGKLSDGDDIKLYVLSVIAGHSYRLDLTAPYDGVVAIGLPNPVEPEDGGDKPDAGFSEVKSKDDNTSGTEKLTFTARTSGQLLVRVKSFGIGETDGAYSLTSTDMGN